MGRNFLAAAVSIVGLAACGGLEGRDLDETASAVSRNQGRVYHTVWNGEAAYAYGGDHSSSYYLSASENRSGRKRDASITFHLTEVDPTSEYCEEIEVGCRPCRELSCECEEEVFTWCYYTRWSHVYGWGAIPSRDFQANGRAARLDTSVNEGFYAERCDIDSLNEIYDCGPASLSGRISAEWAVNGQGSYGSSGTQTHRSGKYLSKWVGNWNSTRANVSGTILGTTMNGEGELSRGVNVSVEHFDARQP